MRDKTGGEVADLLANKMKNNREKKIKKLLLNNYTEINITIYFLLIHHKLDKILENLDDTKVISPPCSLEKKKFLSSEEQLLEIIKYIVENFEREFWFIRLNRNIVLDCLLNNSQSKELIYSKIHIRDNQYLDYFFEEFQKITISNFKKILLRSNINTERLFQENKIKDWDDTKQIYQLLKLICLCNCTSYNLIYLFDNQVNTISPHFCSMQLEILLTRTSKLKKSVSKIINCAN